MQIPFHEFFLQPPARIQFPHSQSVQLRFFMTSVEWSNWFFIFTITQISDN